MIKLNDQIQILGLRILFINSCFFTVSSSASSSEEKVAESSTTTKSKNSIDLPPVDLQDILYDGSWDEFCDRKTIVDNFSSYPYHELKTLRIKICEKKKRNKIDCTHESLKPFAAYKYCEIMRTWADNLLENLLEQFSQKNDEKKTLLLNPDMIRMIRDEDGCYSDSCSKFNDTCVDEFNPFFRMFLPLLARACQVSWLKADQVLNNIDVACSGNRMESEINWIWLLESIKCSI